mmetsp:Transcript_6042/g.12310  ORF Transcript_6042/g.12310 Transcript_6042/m.12310 type:complete len:101 (-) Transcript_6042:948-1250(-)
MFRNMASSSPLLECTISCALFTSAAARLVPSAVAVLDAADEFVDALLLLPAEDDDDELDEEELELELDEDTLSERRRLREFEFLAIVFAWLRPRLFSSEL